MSLPAVFTDAEQAAREWAMDHSGLVGAGLPLTNGAHLGQISGPAHGTWAEITRVGGRTDPSGNLDQPRLSWSVYGPTRAAATGAAIALANALRGIAAHPVDTPAGRILGAYNTSVLYSPDGNHARALVECELLVGLSA